jgi:hypothetical protein
MRENVSVKDFGAVGDGVTDDTAAVQAAIDFISLRTSGTPTRILTIPEGNFLISATLLFQQGTQIIGIGNSNTSNVVGFGSRLKAAPGFVGTALMRYWNVSADPSWHWAKISNIGFNANGNAIKGIDMQEFGETSIIERCVFDGFTSGLYMTGDQASANLFHNTFNNCTIGLHLVACNSTVRVFGISGDGNVNLAKVNGGYSLNCIFYGIKAENYSAGTGAPVILIDDVDGGYVGIFGGWCEATFAHDAMVIAQKTTAVNNPSVEIHGLNGTSGFYTNVYKNTITNKAVALQSGGARPVILDCGSISLTGYSMNNGGVFRGADTAGVYQPMMVATSGNQTETRPLGAGGFKMAGSGGVNTAFSHSQDATQLAFYGSAVVAKGAVTGSRGGNAALASLLTKLAVLGLITDSTTA